MKAKRSQLRLWHGVEVDANGQTITVCAVHYRRKLKGLWINQYGDVYTFQDLNGDALHTNGTWTKFIFRQPMPRSRNWNQVATRAIDIRRSTLTLVGKGVI
ncbi:MAG TPA: hypothetical protein VN155_16720 [Devosia sp.]|nr:hypothetical protein [Devosia sp.]